MNFLSIQLPPIIASMFLVVYVLLLFYTIIRILLDTHSTAKTLSYLLIVIAFPLFGIIFYFAFGINYRRRKSNKLASNSYQSVTKEFEGSVEDNTAKLVARHKDFLTAIYFAHFICTKHRPREPKLKSISITY